MLKDCECVLEAEDSKSTGEIVTNFMKRLAPATDDPKSQHTHENSSADKFKTQRFEKRLGLVNADTDVKSENGFVLIAPVCDGRVNIIGVEQ